MRSRCMRLAMPAATRICGRLARQLRRLQYWYGRQWAAQPLLIVVTNARVVAEPRASTGARLDARHHQTIAVTGNPRNRGSAGQRQPSGRTNSEDARMPRLARSKQCSRSGSLTTRKRRSRLSPVRHLANPASLIGIPRLGAAHAGSRITFGCSDLTVLAQTLVEIGLASESDWIAAGKVPAALVDSVIRRFLREHGQETIAKHFELYLTLGESIVDTSYSDDGPDSNGQLFLVLNTESSLPLGVGTAIEGLEESQPGLGLALYNTFAKPCIAGCASMTTGTPATVSSRWSSGRKARRIPIRTRFPNSNKTCRSASKAANRQGPGNPWIPSRYPPNNG